MSDAKEDFKEEVLLPPKKRQRQRKKRLPPPAPMHVDLSLPAPPVMNKRAPVRQRVNPPRMLGDAELWARMANVEAQRDINSMYDAERPVYEHHIRAGYCGQYVQFDILDVSTLKGVNGIGYFANFLDVYSKYAWVFPLNHKDDLRKEIGRIMTEIRNTNPANVQDVYNRRVKAGKQRQGSSLASTPYPEYIYSDDEATAKALDFQELLRNSGTKWTPILNQNKMPLQAIERFNAVMRKLIRNYREIHKTNVYFDKIQPLVRRYNAMVNRNTTLAPEDIYMDGRKWHDLRKDQAPPKLNIGDYVRIREKVNLFDKASWTRNFSREVYQVVGHKKRYRFSVQQLGAQRPEETGYKPEQLKLLTRKEGEDARLEVANERKGSVPDEKVAPFEEELKVMDATRRQVRFLTREGLFSEDIPRKTAAQEAKALVVADAAAEEAEMGAIIAARLFRELAGKRIPRAKKKTAAELEKEKADEARREREREEAEEAKERLEEAEEEKELKLAERKVQELKEKMRSRNAKRKR